MKSKPTYELDVEIKKSDSIKDFIENNQNQFQEIAFFSYINELLNLKVISKSTIVKNSNLSKSYVYELLSGANKKEPKRDSVIKLAFGLSLNLEQANRLLKLAGHGELYSKKKRDSIIIFCLNTSKSIVYANEILHDEELELLELCKG